VQRKFLGVNLIDRNVDVDVIGVVMYDTDPLVFRISQLMAKTLFNCS